MPAALDKVYLDGAIVPLAQACVPVLDRGFLYGDAVYEVIAVYGGEAFVADRHVARLQRSLGFLRCADPLPAAGWLALVDRLIAANAPLPPRAAVYLQVTRGGGTGRAPAFPEGVAPRVVGFCLENPAPPAQALQDGLAAVLLADPRWRACHIKTTSLLANVLARDTAGARGAAEALLHRNGLVHEGSSSNVLIWNGTSLVSPPDGPDILPGVTRDVVLEQAADAGVPCERAPVTLEHLRTAQEVWITSTTREVLPVTRIDGEPVGGGRPGEQWRAAFARLQASLPVPAAAASQPA